MTKLSIIVTVAMTLLLAASPSVASSTPRSATSAAQAQDVGAVYFINPRVGWASADNSTRLLMTTDGGALWQNISPPMLRRVGFDLANGLVGADFLSPTDFFVSLYGPGAGELLSVLLLHTTDSGREWTEVGSFLSGADEAWISFLNNQRGWVAIGGGAAAGTSPVTIYATTDAGAHWAVIARSPSPNGGPGTAYSPGGCGHNGLTWSGSLRAPVLWLTGTSNVAPCVRESTDGGRRWENGGIFDPSAGSGGTAWSPVFSSGSVGALAVFDGTAGGGFMAFYSTTTGGKTWVEHRTPSAGPGLSDVVSATTWFAARDKTIYRTINGGATWTGIHASIKLGVYLAPGTLDFVNGADGWAVLNGHVWHTTDAGRIWFPQDLPT